MIGANINAAFQPSPGAIANAIYTENHAATCPNPENALANPVAKPLDFPGHQFASNAIPGDHNMDWKYPLKPQRTAIIIRDDWKLIKIFAAADKNTQITMNLLIPNTSANLPLNKCPMPYVQKNIPDNKPRSAAVH